MKPSLSRSLIQFGSKFHSYSSELFQEIQPEDVTPLQFEILKYSTFNADVTLGMIADCLKLNTANASREVRKLAEKGLLQKRGGELDKRVIYVELSPSGRALMNQVLAGLEDQIRKRYKNLGAADLQNLLEAIETLDRLLF